jgi:hypothetical protein
MYRLPALGLEVRACIVLPLAIHFAVHEEQPIVFLRYAKLLTGLA